MILLFQSILRFGFAAPPSLRTSVATISRTTQMQPPAICRSSSIRATLIASAVLVLAALVTSCATVPSRSTGTSEASFTSANEIPRRVTLRTKMVGQDDPIGRVLSAELPRLGFSVEYEDIDGAFVAVTRSSDFGPSSLELSLVAENTGRVLWTARIERAWDMYASIIEQHEQNAHKALALLERDLARAGFTAP